MFRLFYLKGSGFSQKNSRVMHKHSDTCSAMQYRSVWYRHQRQLLWQFARCTNHLSVMGYVNKTKQISGTHSSLFGKLISDLLLFGVAVVIKIKPLLLTFQLPGIRGKITFFFLHPFSLGTREYSFSVFLLPDQTLFVCSVQSLKINLS